jgi:hypothetical protein
MSDEEMLTALTAEWFGEVSAEELACLNEGKKTM